MNHQFLVDYKLIFLIRYRLKCVIGKVVFESRSSFVKDRQIVDGLLIANETMDETKKNERDLITFKVDFENTYDSMDWSCYLLSILKIMNFPSKWKSQMSWCLRITSIYVFVKRNDI